MTRGKLIVGFICLCCLLQTANALNDRTQKLLEVQSTNRPTNGAPKNVNTRPTYGPVNGVFSPQSANPAPAPAPAPAAITVVPIKK